MLFIPPALLFDADVLRPIEMSLQEGLLPKTVADVKGVARIPSFAVLLSHFGAFGVPVVEEKELQIFFCLMATSLIRRMDDREIAWWIISLEFGCEILFWNNWLLIVASKEFERWYRTKRSFVILRILYAVSASVNTIQKIRMDFRKIGNKP